MYLEILLADFAVCRIFWGISQKYLNFAGPRPREISEALPWVLSASKTETKGLPNLQLATRVGLELKAFKLQVQCAKHLVHCL